MKFDIKNYPGKYCMHCATKTEAEEFEKCLRKQGSFLLSRDSSFLSWSICGSGTVYFFNNHSYDHIDYAKENGYVILEWKDFDNKNSFTKHELVDGDVVMYATGVTAIYVSHFNCFINGCSENVHLNEYVDDLRNKHNASYSIKAARRPRNYAECCLDIFKEGKEKGVLIYSATEEVEEMTMEEVCAALGKNIKIVKEK